MNILEIVSAFDKENHRSHCVDSYIFVELLGIHCDSMDYAKVEDALKSYFYANWRCTDTLVGGRIYYLHDEPVAVSWQEGRKCCEDIEFLSVETAEKLKAFLMDCIIVDPNKYDIVEENKDLGNGYRISYGSQLVTNKAKYLVTGETVTITQAHSKMYEIDKWRIVLIETSEGIIEVPLSDLEFPWGV